MAISKMLCLLGTQDITVIQDQPKFVVDLLESNIVLYGSSMSGKTNFIKLLVTIYISSIERVRSRSLSLTLVGL